jgi:hypothetical protein
MDEFASAQTNPDAVKTENARDLQARLYREIGISAVAAALRFTALPDPGAEKPAEPQIPVFLRDHLAA